MQATSPSIVDQPAGVRLSGIGQTEPALVFQRYGPGRYAWLRPEAAHICLERTADLERAQAADATLSRQQRAEMQP